MRPSSTRHDNAEFLLSLFYNHMIAPIMIWAVVDLNIYHPIENLMICLFVSEVFIHAKSFMFSNI